MNPAQKALWFIESHLAEPLTLDEIAGVGGVSRFHMVRAFAAATGLSVMRYVRARRLSEAARALANGAPDILTWRWMRITALTKHSPARSATISGSRPRRSAPSTRLDHLKLQEPILMDSTITRQSSAPRFETGKAAARRRHRRALYAAKTAPAFPASGSAFINRSPTFPAGSGRWLTASAATATMPEISTTSPASRFPTSPICRANSPAVRIPEQRYAVFTHRDHISTIRRTINTIWNHWLPASGMKAADAPNFERYDENFDPLTGNGGLEIWFRCGTELAALGCPALPGASLIAWQAISTLP